MMASSRPSLRSISVGEAISGLVGEWKRRHGLKKMATRISQISAYPHVADRVEFPELKAAFMENGWSIKEVSDLYRALNHANSADQGGRVNWKTLVSVLREEFSRPLDDDFACDRDLLKEFVDRLRRYDKERSFVVPIAAVSCVCHDMKIPESSIQDAFQYMYPAAANFLNIEPLYSWVNSGFQSLPPTTPAASYLGRTTPGQTPMRQQNSAHTPQQRYSGIQGDTQQSTPATHRTSNFGPEVRHSAGYNNFTKRENFFNPSTSSTAVAAGRPKSQGEMARSPGDMSVMTAMSAGSSFAGGQLRRSYELWAEGRLSTSSFIDELRIHGKCTSAVEDKLRQNDFARGLTYAQILKNHSKDQGTVNEKVVDGPKKFIPCFKDTGIRSSYNESSAINPVFGWDGGDLKSRKKDLAPKITTGDATSAEITKGPSFGDPSYRANHNVYFVDGNSNHKRRFDHHLTRTENEDIGVDTHSKRHYERHVNSPSRPQEDSAGKRHYDGVGKECETEYTALNRYERRHNPHDPIHHETHQFPDMKPNTNGQGARRDHTYYNFNEVDDQRRSPRDQRRSPRDRRSPRELPPKITNQAAATAQMQRGQMASGKDFSPKPASYEWEKAVPNVPMSKVQSRYTSNSEHQYSKTSTPAYSKTSQPSKESSDAPIRNPADAAREQNRERNMRVLIEAENDGLNIVARKQKATTNLFSTSQPGGLFDAPQDGAVSSSSNIEDKRFKSAVHGSHGNIKGKRLDHLQSSINAWGENSSSSSRNEAPNGPHGRNNGNSSMLASKKGGNDDDDGSDYRVPSNKRNSAYGGINRHTAANALSPSSPFKTRSSGQTRPESAYDDSYEGRENYSGRGSGGVYNNNNEYNREFLYHPDNGYPGDTNSRSMGGDYLNPKQLPAKKHYEPDSDLRMKETHVWESQSPQNPYANPYSRDCDGEETMPIGGYRSGLMPTPGGGLPAGNCYRNEGERRHISPDRFDPRHELDDCLHHGDRLHGGRREEGRYNNGRFDDRYDARRDDRYGARHDARSDFYDDRQHDRQSRHDGNEYDARRQHPLFDDTQDSRYEERRTRDYDSGESANRFDQLSSIL